MVEGGKVCEIGLLFQCTGPHSMPTNRGLWLLTPPRDPTFHFWLSWPLLVAFAGAL